MSTRGREGVKNTQNPVNVVYEQLLISCKTHLTLIITSGLYIPKLCIFHCFWSASGNKFLNIQPTHENVVNLHYKKIIKGSRLDRILFAHMTDGVCRTNMRLNLTLIFNTRHSMTYEFKLKVFSIKSYLIHQFLR